MIVRCSWLWCIHGMMMPWTDFFRYLLLLSSIQLLNYVCSNRRKKSIVCKRKTFIAPLSQTQSISLYFASVSISNDIDTFEEVARILHSTEIDTFMQRELFENVANAFELNWMSICGFCVVLTSRKVHFSKKWNFESFSLRKAFLTLSLSFIKEIFTKWNKLTCDNSKVRDIFFLLKKIKQF